MGGRAGGGARGAAGGGGAPSLERVMSASGISLMKDVGKPGDANYQSAFITTKGGKNGRPYQFTMHATVGESMKVSTVKTQDAAKAQAFVKGIFKSYPEAKLY